MKYVNKIFLEFFKQKCILHQTTCIDAPQQNGVSEKKNRHLLIVTRSLFFQNNVPKTYCSDAVLTITYLINRSIKIIILGYSSEKRDINAMTQKLTNFIYFVTYYFLRMKPIINQIINIKMLHK
jgi:hypothetical protein